MSARTPQEEDRLPARKLLLVGLTGIALTVLIGVGASLLVETRPLQRPPGAASVEQSLIDRADRAVRLAAAQRQQLTSYGWVDRARGIAHIPIDDAIELVLRRGQP